MIEVAGGILLALLALVLLPIIAPIVIYGLAAAGFLMAILVVIEVLMGAGQ